MLVRIATSPTVQPGSPEPSGTRDHWQYVGGYKNELGSPPENQMRSFLEGRGTQW